MARICKVCGVKEDEHCTGDFADVPDGCACASGEWGFPIPPVCGEFRGNDEVEGEDDRCATCEHDRACHKEKP